MYACVTQFNPFSALRLILYLIVLLRVVYPLLWGTRTQYYNEIAYLFCSNILKSAGYNNHLQRQLNNWTNDTFIIYTTWSLITLPQVYIKQFE